MNRVLKKKMATAPLAVVKPFAVAGAVTGRVFSHAPNFMEVDQARDRSKRDGNKSATGGGRVLEVKHVMA